MGAFYQKHRFVTDPQGNKIAVIVPIDEYEKILEKLDELEDIRLYDESKLADSEYLFRII
ncbi:hypothetical protein [Algoriphagus antarcticus]|uniref:Antitoxin Phd_YefM of type II toxin-antitoxin system n=1 Tax=Algoriphagus antarcticus TaxID=238540 RepID=A0A3E0E3R8_9BACT|nr:hypothetical protein [Algoriphagus antarcticus]REG91989.1 hypothetical protein C8N25_10366 [Algoriphagus antarcticus]